MLEKSLEILKNLKIKDNILVEKTKNELDILEKENKLDDFYNVWKKHNGKIGHINKINSWTAYCLGMTTVKPNGEFLPERRVFARAGFPDIDSDFDYFRRDDIYNYIIEKYGRESVGNIGTYSLLKLKSAVRRIGKALDVANAFHKGPKDYTTINEAKVKEILDALPKPRGAFLKVNDEEGKEQTIKTIFDAYKYCPDFRKYMDKFPGIKEHAKNIEGLISNTGIHASGLCISNEPLSRVAPMKVSKKGLATQFAYEDLEAIGIIKFDILAISTLTVIKNTVDLIYENYGIKIDIKNIVPNDKKTFELYRSGNLIGVFQAEGKGMQETFQEIETSNFNDIMATIALYRPGPMGSIPEYCARKKGLKNIDYFHPSIEKYVKPYLEETYGVLCYQESVMQICNALAGFSITDGYVMIKGVCKKKKEIIDLFRKQFVEGCCKKGIPQNIAEQYWDKFIVPFSSYGFNKSHACCYALLSYSCAYLKANYPDEFMVCYLNVENRKKQQDSHEKVALLERDLSNFNIELLPKDINTCNVDYEIVKKKNISSGVLKTQIMPAIICKGIGVEVAEDVVKRRPYTDLRSIAHQTTQGLFTKESLGCLIEAGFFADEYKEANKGKNRKEKISVEKFKEVIVNKFDSLRKDKKKSADKGIGSEGLFD